MRPCFGVLALLVLASVVFCLPAAATNNLFLHQQYRLQHL
jgi:hypothetical protein